AIGVDARDRGVDAGDGRGGGMRTAGAAGHRRAPDRGDHGGNDRRRGEERRRRPGARGGADGAGRGPAPVQGQRRRRAPAVPRGRGVLRRAAPGSPHGRGARGDGRAHSRGGGYGQHPARLAAPHPRIRHVRPARVVRRAPVVHDRGADRKDAGRGGPRARRGVPGERRALPPRAGAAGRVRPPAGPARTRRAAGAGHGARRLQLLRAAVRVRSARAAGHQHRRRGGNGRRARAGGLHRRAPHSGRLRGNVHRPADHRGRARSRAGAGLRRADRRIAVLRRAGQRGHPRRHLRGDGQEQHRHPGARAAARAL
ncbi:MAG: Manganese ABC transporter, periplasmic-binding protein SitA, partial [uncultured Gemmatimonadetes bacterium]